MYIIIAIDYKVKWQVERMLELYNSNGKSSIL